VSDRYETEQRYELVKFTQEVVGKISESMFHLDQEIKLCLVAIFTRGHVLLEGNPGLGKTALVKSLSRSLNLTYGRIQFTPDLMPADITGTEMPDKDQVLCFRRGPIFKTLLLADEINRASPKTQSAMLEAMAERQVTVLGKTYFLPVFFTVLATENPIDHEGTYPLPEAQSDRFMFKINLKPQIIEAIQQITEKDAGSLTKEDTERDEFRLDRHISSNFPESGNNPDPFSTGSDIDTQKKLLGFYKTIRNVQLYPPNTEKNTLGLLDAAQHINNMYLASNGQVNGNRRQLLLDQKQVEWIEKQHKRLQYGLGPRSATALSMAVKAWSVMFPPKSDVLSIVPDAVAMAHVAKCVLRHRLKLTDLWEERGGNDQAEEFLKDFIINTSPQQNDYKRILEKEMA
jgi:MoxR-like ATPase